MGWLTLEEGGSALTLHIIAQQFLPLGVSVEGNMLQMPPGLLGGTPQEPFSAANSSLHPYITVVGTTRQHSKSAGSTAMQSARESYRVKPVFSMVGSHSLARYENCVIDLTCLPGASDFGDNFALRSPDLGGRALARSPLFGRLRLQFGPIGEGKMPFVLHLESPSAALDSKAAQLLSLLPPGTRPGLVGMHGEMHFPLITFEQEELSLTTDPYKVSVGVIDLETGSFENLILRAYLFQNVMRNLLMVEPRTPTDSFCYVCDGKIQATAEGLTLQLYGDFTIPYPAGYAFPLPGGRKTRIEPGSHLLPFVNLTAVTSDSFKPSTEPMEFAALQHVRGRLTADTRLTIAPAAGSMIATLQSGKGFVAGGVTGLSVAKIDKFHVTRFEAQFPRPGRQPDENVLGFSFDRDGEDELLMVSEGENMDSWLTGTITSHAAPARESNA